MQAHEEFILLYLGLLVVGVMVLSPAAMIYSQVDDGDRAGISGIRGIFEADKADYAGRFTGLATGEVTGKVVDDVTGKVVQGVSANAVQDITASASREITTMVTQDVTTRVTEDVTGEAVSQTASVSIFVLGQTNVNFSAELADDHESVRLSWGNKGATNYSIYATDNMSRGFNYSDPLAVGITDTNYTDTDAGDYQQRYYMLGEYFAGVESLSDYAVGKFDIMLEHSTLTPGEIEMNSVSLPLLLQNSSVNHLLWNGQVGDVISTYNTTRSPPAFDSIRKFPSGWFGQFGQFLDWKGYDFTIVGQAYNLTVTGIVPTGARTVPLTVSTLVPGQVEMNSIGWNSVYTKCNFSQVLSSDATVGDVISTYNAYRSPPAYDSIRKFPSGWFGQFSCFEPGRGYTFTIVGNAYNWTYARDP